MILTKEVMYRGKMKPVEELAPSSEKRVDVKCPECGEVRNVMYKSLKNAGHHRCMSCVNPKTQGRPLILGEKYGRLTVIDKRPNKSKVKCDCGKITYVNNWNLTNGKTKSCGCLRVENMKKVGVYPADKDHWNWKGGIASERERAMQSKEYKDWRKEVFERDNHTCQICGQVGYKLNAHHLDNYAEFPEVRTELTNGITLCESCHNSFHSIYGYGCTKEDYVDFTKGENYD